MLNNKFSVVIICLNARETIEQTIASSLRLSDDVVVVDSGSTDGTIEMISSTKARLIHSKWMGYGPTKNYGNSLAKNDWILSLDSDEFIDSSFIESLVNIDYSDHSIIYSVKRVSYLGLTPVWHGEWGRGVIRRVFNRQVASWDSSPVHEELLSSQPFREVQLRGYIHHFTSPNIVMYREKLDKYAHLMAKKYVERRKRTYAFKRVLSPLFNFVQNYFLRAGFLDGKTGFEIARAHAWYTKRKYQLLTSMQD